MVEVSAFIAPVSTRSARVHRVVLPFEDRSGLFRMDRNEDVSGWEHDHLNQMLSRIQSADLAAYHDADQFQKRLAEFLGVTVDGLTITSGSSEAIQMVFETYLDAGTKVLALEPSYGLYEVFAAKCGAELLRFHYADDLRLNIDALVQRISDAKPQLVVIANPNQPTGTALDEHDLRRIASSAVTVGAILLVDEAYFHFSPVTAINLCSEYPNVVITQTFSKAFGLAGLRLGYCVGPTARIQEIEKLRALTQSNALALKAASYVLENKTWALERVADVIAGRDYLVERFLESNLNTFPSNANFVLLGCPSEESAITLVEEARKLGYAIRGPLATPPLADFVRITAGPLSVMETFWEQSQELILNLAARRGD